MSVKNNKASSFAAMSAITMLLASIQGCATTPPPSVVALPNGYYLKRDRATNIGLVTRDGKQIVRGPIAAYRVSGNVVAGCVGEWPKRAFSYPNETPFPDSTDCRYFILDTPSGRLEQGLDPASWRARLKDSGVSESLKITAPVLPL
jgi:hypothetical protein